VSESDRGGSGGRAQFGATIVTIGDRDVAGVRVGCARHSGGRRSGVTGRRRRRRAGKTGLSGCTHYRVWRCAIGIPGEFAFDGGLPMDEYGWTSLRPAGIYIKM